MYYGTGAELGDMKNEEKKSFNYYLKYTFFKLYKSIFYSGKIELMTKFKIRKAKSINIIIQCTME